MAASTAAMDKAYEKWLQENFLTFKTPNIDALLRSLYTKGLVNEDLLGLVGSKWSNPAKCDELYRHLGRFTFAKIGEIIQCMEGSQNDEVAKQFSDFKHLCLERHDLGTPTASSAGPPDFYEDTEPLALKVAVKRARGLGGTEGSRYKMTSKPRGLALIINNRVFNDPQQNRPGSEHDFDALLKLFGSGQLDYEVTALENVTSRDLPGILTLFKSQFKYKAVDSCFVCIMSHGSEHSLLMADCIEINYWRDLIWQFDGNQFAHFADKPKIIVIAACAVFDDMDATAIAPAWTPVTPVSPPPAPQVTNPDLRNMLVCTATLPGTPATRDIFKGTWYIYCLVEVIMENAHCTEAKVLFGEMVQQRMQRIRSRSSRLQLPEFRPYLFDKDFYFNPGVELPN